MCSQRIGLSRRLQWPGLENTRRPLSDTNGFSLNEAFRGMWLVWQFHGFAIAAKTTKLVCKAGGYLKLYRICVAAV